MQFSVFIEYSIPSGSAEIGGQLFGVRLGIKKSFRAFDTALKQGKHANHVRSWRRVLYNRPSVGASTQNSADQTHGKGKEWKTKPEEEILSCNWLNLTGGICYPPG